MPTSDSANRMRAVARSVGREQLDHPVDRPDRVLGVQGAEHQVAGLGGRQRRGGGGVVADLADHDHVGVLAHRGDQRLRERRRVHPELALHDDRAFRAVQVLDGVLDRHDHLRVGGVDLVEDARQRRRLARTGGPGDEDEALLLVLEVVDRLLRQVHDLQGLLVRVDDAQHGAHRAALAEQVHAEPAEPRHAVGEVDLLLGCELGALLLVAHQVDQRLGRPRRERHVVHGPEAAADAHHHGQGHVQVHVGRPRVHRLLE